MKRILAIDFGTNNTYFSVTTIGGSVIPCNFFSGGDNDKGIDSACLRFTKGSHQGQIAIGKKALNYYGGASDDDIQSAGMVLATNFKPDIEISEDARQNSICFLKEALKLYQQNDKTLNPLEMDVILAFQARRQKPTSAVWLILQEKPDTEISDCWTNHLAL